MIQVIHYLQKNSQPIRGAAKIYLQIFNNSDSAFSYSDLFNFHWTPENASQLNLYKSYGILQIPVPWFTGVTMILTITRLHLLSVVVFSHFRYLRILIMAKYPMDKT